MRLRLVRFGRIAVLLVLACLAARSHAAAGPSYMVSSETTPGLQVTDLAIDVSGNAYVAGRLGTSNWPGIDSTRYPNAGFGYRVLARYAPSGIRAQFTAIVGWPQGAWQSAFNAPWFDDDELSGLAVDAAGNAYLVAYDTTTNFPNIGTQFQRSTGALYVYKVSSAGAVTRHSVALPAAIRRVTAIARDAAGALYLTGTALDGLATTPGAPFGASSVAPTCVSPYVIKLDPTGQNIVYATYLGYSGTQGQLCGGSVYTLIYKQYIHPTGFAIAVDTAGNAYVTGQAEPGFMATPGALDLGTKVPGQYPYDSLIPAPASHAFVTKINPSGTGIVFNARIGGSLRDRGTSIAIDATGGIVVAGKTSSQDFPSYGSPSANLGGLYATVCRLYSPEYGFVARLPADGSRLLFSYVLPMDGGQLDDCGGATDDYAPAKVALDAAGNIVVAGFTAPTYRYVYGTPGAVLPDPVGNESQNGNQVLWIFSPDGAQLRYGSVLPQYNVRGLAVDRWQNIVVASGGALLRLSAGQLPVDVKISPYPPCAGTTTTLTALLPGANDSGTVDFIVDGTSVGSVNVTDSTAVKSLSLAVGVRRIKAVYHGAGPFDGHTSLNLAVPVNQAGACQ
jgi:hypothetical protein